MKKIKITYRTPERYFDMLRSHWENSDYENHFIQSILLNSQLLQTPGLTANSILPKIVQFIDRNGPYGVDGILLSSISSCISINQSNHDLKQAFDLCKSINRRWPYEFKNSFMIHFIDFLGFSTGILQNLDINLPSRIRGVRNQSSRIVFDENLRPQLNPDFRYGSGDFYEINNRNVMDNKITPKTINAMTSLFPDINRDRVFQAFGADISDSSRNLMQFGTALRETGKKHYNRPELGDNNKSWLMSGNDNDYGFQAYDAFLKFGAAIVGFKGAAGIQPSSGYGGAAAGVLTINLIPDNFHKDFYNEQVDQAESYISSIANIFSSETDKDNAESGREVNAQVDDVNTSDSGSSTTGNSDNSEDNDDAIHLDLTKDNAGEDVDPDAEIEYPVPDGVNQGNHLPPHIIGEYLNKILSGQPPSTQIYPNPNGEPMGNYGNNIIHNIATLPIDKYIYPNPNKNLTSQYTEEDLFKLTAQRLGYLVYPKPEED